MNDLSVLQQQTLGLDAGHLCRLDDGTEIHQQLCEPWFVLLEAAHRAGFDLAIASAYRSFDRQLQIWNAKLSGQRPMVDDRGQAIVTEGLSSYQRMQYVLRWSSIPGASRHHWGSELDIYDRAAIDSDYRLQLVPAEYVGNGPFAPMLSWLREYLIKYSALGFFFPYDTDRGGIAPEPWHLSYRPVADNYQRQWSLSVWQSYLLTLDFCEKITLFDHFDTLYQQYVKSVIYP